MKKFILFFFCIIVISGGVFLFYMNNKETKKEKKKPEEKKQTSEELDKYKSIDALFIKNENNMMQILYQNRYYSLSIDNSINKELTYGDYINIKYDKEFDFNQEKQNIIVEDVTDGNKDNYKESLIDQGIFKEQIDKAYDKLKNMSIDEKIGQLLLVRVPDIKAKETVKKYQFGGYILFGRDVVDKTKEDIKNSIKGWNEVSNIPLLIASDEEGGIVTRVSKNNQLTPNRFLSPQALYKKGKFKAIREDNTEKNKLLYSLGINLNLAPVADVSTDPNDYIYSRSFGQNAKATGEFIKNILESSKGTNVSNTLKHFPGYGNNKDTHTGISIDKRTIEEFRKNDFIPFKIGIENKAESILVSHNIIENIENNIPASLSLNIHKLLRNELKFDGIIMTDDLEMDAINKYVKNSTLEALKSGNDLIMVSDYETSYKEIKNALDNKEISESLIDKAVIRTIAWKIYKNLI